tara:strand:+ start:168 stop:1757 length:1590 start_codon:yes stop_codon:yes gene_type:complete
MKKNKNVLFITADQWRGDCLGCIGHPWLKTPNLDQLARDGTIFRKHYAQTVPCGPSRASLFTGLYAMNHRSVNNGTPLNKRFTNIAKEVRKLGYDPTLFGYTDTSVDPRDYHERDPILTSYEGMIPGISSGITLTDNQRPWIAELVSRGYDKSLNENNIFKPKLNYPGSEQRGVTFSPPIYSCQDSSVAFLTNELLKWLKVRSEENWFVHLSYLRPHPPWIAPEPYNSLYDPSLLKKPIRKKTIAEESSQHPLLKMLLDLIPRKGFFPNDQKLPASQANDIDISQAVATYFGLMTEVDFHLGRLIDFLKDSNQYDSTLIIFTSDHGEHLGDHYLFGKLGYFDQAYHIPLIIRDPENQKNTESYKKEVSNIEIFTESIDIMPTILDWLEAKIPEECNGSSLSSLIKGIIPKNWRKEVHWEYDFRGIGSIQPMIEKKFGLSPDQCSLTVIRDDKFKYVHMTALPPLLFDLKEDPNEFENRVNDPNYKNKVIEYAQKMLSWTMLHRDRTLVNMNMESGELIHWEGSRVLGDI